ncbi:MAG: hypothetical protein M1376_10910 [Planctomycetes bacterium]|nr:hypothetical protein [Planctomycetota bacterium]
MDLITTRFLAGELSSKMAGRTDLEEYYAGARQEENVLTKPGGGATRRPGFEVVGWTEGGSIIGGEL